MIIDKEIEDNIKAGVNRKNKSITLILISIALNDLNFMRDFHPQKSVLMQKINHYKSLQNQIMKL